MRDTTCIKCKRDTSDSLFTSLSSVISYFFIANKHILNLKLETWLFFPFHYGVLISNFKIYGVLILNFKI